MAMIGTVLGVVGSVIGGIAQMKQMQFQAAVADANAKQMEYNADAAANAAGQDVEDIGMQGRGELGILRTEQGASGLSIGSPGFQRGETGFLGRVYRSALRAHEAGFQQHAAFRTQAGIFRAEAQASRSAAPLALLTGVLGGIGSAVGSFGGGGAGSLVGTAQPTIMSPGYVPIPRRRPTYALG